MVIMISFTISISKELNKKLEKLAKLSNRSKRQQVAYILEQVLNNYDEFFRWLKEKQEREGFVL